MTIRAVCVGLLIGLGISLFTYFNDNIAGQTSLIGNFMPLSVFGVVTLILVLGNPLLERLRAGWGLRGGEIAVIVAIALAACSFPGHNFSHYFVSMTALPARTHDTRTDWQANRIMSYIPGGSSLLAEGQVRDWAKLVAQVRANLATDELPGRLYTQSSVSQRAAWDAAFAANSLSNEQIQSLLAAINGVLARPTFTDTITPGQAQHEVERHNRRALEQAMPGVLISPPPGAGALVADGRVDPQVSDILGQGLHSGEVLPLSQVPWHIWWPTIRLWGGAALCLAGVSLCLALILHHQWSANELLQYPLAQFIEMIGKRESGRSIPNIATTGLFWCGFAALLFLHGVNGLNAWFPNVPQISTTFDFLSFSELFPGIFRVPLSATIFRPTLYLYIFAFAFMLNRSVSFTLGISPIVFVLFGAVLVANGIAIPYDKFSPNNINLLRMGSFLGMTITIVYMGRTYYRQVLGRALGLRTHTAVAASAVWAARCIAPLLVIAVALLLTSGMSLLTAGLMIAVCLMIWVVMARICAETGMVWISAPFVPLGVLPALLGYQTLGPTQMLLLGIGGFLLVGDPRECLMPYVLNGLRMAERTGTAPQKIAPWMFTILVVGAVISIVVAVALQYEYGFKFSDTYVTTIAPDSAFNDTSRAISRLASEGTLAASVAMTDGQRLLSLSPEPWALGWLGAGLALVLLTMWARVRLPWWPIHPVLFLVMGTWAISVLWFSFLLGWVAKSVALATGGVRSYQRVLPLMVGIIAGELIGRLFWLIVGITYYLSTGLPPVSY